jgi:predicted ABC-type transport system involved in lysophospholipase L1 biosynthesis ATPase subunit
VTEAGPLVELRDVSRSYGTAALPTVVLRGITLAIEAGESVAVVGPSGSGKSTLLNLLGALDRPSAGKVLFEGRDLGGLGPDELASLRNRKIGFVFQAHHLLPQCTALENVLVPTLPRSDAGARGRATALLERVGLAERVHHRPAQLSGGECQRVAVVRALVNRPRLVLADEPTGSLDAAAAHELAELLSELNREEGVTLVTATHAEPLAARMERRLELSGGRLAPAADRA